MAPPTQLHSQTGWSSGSTQIFGIAKPITATNNAASSDQARVDRNCWVIIRRRATAT